MHGVPARHFEHLTVSDLDKLSTIDLHDGRIRELALDPAARTVEMSLDCGDAESGYLRIQLSFIDAEVVPDDVVALACAVTATYRLHGRIVMTEVVEHGVGAISNGRVRLSIRLWPFHQFAVDCTELSMRSEPLSNRGPIGRARFTIASGSGSPE